MTPRFAASLLSLLLLAPPGVAAPPAGDWRLPAEPPSPPDNRQTPERAGLGKMLFFDPRLSGTGQVTCASCHLPERGWADGLPTAVRFLGAVMPVATPSLTNIGYHGIFMWDGRQPTLEDQAFGGQGERADINAGSKVPTEAVVARLAAIDGYRDAFARAYPGEGVTRKSIAKAIASFERSLVSRDSPFDRWVAGEADALDARAQRGFAVFMDPARGACATCHQPPTFSDDGFHNIGLKSFGQPGYDRGRGKHRNVKAMDGAFKTPGLRDVALTAPYFHDGSARTLGEVVEHYMQGGVSRGNLSPSFRPARLTDGDKADLLAFLESLTSPQAPFVYPVLPR